MRRMCAYGGRRIVFEDKQIAEQRYWEKRKKFTGIGTGIYSRDELLEFREFRLFSGKVGVILPVVFNDMEIEEARQKYHSEQRPEIIKTNSDGSINFAFNLVGQADPNRKPETIIFDFRRMMKLLHPTNICLNIDSKPDAPCPYAWMEFTSCAVNENLYNMLSLYLIGDELLMMMFNCPLEERTEWLLCLSQIREW